MGQACPAAGIVSRFFTGGGQRLTEEVSRFRFYQYGQGAEEVGYFARGGNVPMFRGGIAPQVLFQPFGEDVSAAGDDEVGAHGLFRFRAQG